MNLATCCTEEQTTLTTMDVQLAAAQVTQVPVKFYCDE